MNSECVSNKTCKCCNKSKKKNLQNKNFIIKKKKKKLITNIKEKHLLFLQKGDSGR